MGKTLAQMTAEIREVVTSKGFRPAEGGPGTNTWGDYVALLHSEIAEMLEAFRRWELADATESHVDPVEHHDRMHGICGHGETRGNCRATFPSKPEGVGSEAADTLIRLLDMCDTFGIRPFDMDMELADVSPLDLPPGLDPSTFGGWNSLLHGKAHKMDPFASDQPEPLVPGHATRFLRTLILFTEKYDIDLMAEYERKIAYNRTREWRHGGRVL